MYELQSPNLAPAQNKHQIHACCVLKSRAEDHPPIMLIEVNHRDERWTVR